MKENKPEKDKIYKGKVNSVVPYGAFISIGAAKDGLCHISEMSEQRVMNVEDIVKKGDEVYVKVLDITPKGIKLSMKGVDKPADPA